MYSASGVGVGDSSAAGVVLTVIIDVLVVRDVEVLVGSWSADASVDASVEISSVFDKLAVSEDKVDRIVVVIWTVERLESAEVSAVAVTVEEGTVTVVKPPPPADSTVEAA